MKENDDNHQSYDPVHTRIKNLHFLAIACVLPGVVLSLAAEIFSSIPSLPRLADIVGIAVGLFFAWYFFRILDTRCPVCQGRFFTLYHYWAYEALGRRNCSKCGHGTGTHDP